MSGQALESTVKPLWEKAAEAIKTMTSGFADEATYQARLASCRACKHLDKAEGDANEYCGLCGCGRWPLARLDRKLYFKELECPIGAKGFANEGQPREQRPCSSCDNLKPKKEPLEIGTEVVITVKLPKEKADERLWRITARRGDVYDIERSRRGLDWLVNRGRKEEATVSRDAIGKKGTPVTVHHGMSLPERRR